MGTGSTDRGSLQLCLPRPYAGREVTVSRMYVCVFESSKRFSIPIQAGLSLHHRTSCFFFLCLVQLAGLMLLPPPTLSSTFGLSIPCSGWFKVLNGNPGTVNSSTVCRRHRIPDPQRPRPRLRPLASYSPCKSPRRVSSILLCGDSAITSCLPVIHRRRGP
ncbi:hypothetical protein HDV57DRAFT_414853 [Trichoderma longibrachiatum]